MEKIKSTKDFLWVTKPNSSPHILPKKYIHEICKAQSKGNCVIVMCYPGMSNTEIVVDATIEEIWEHLV
jgi:hypothetical protein